MVETVVLKTNRFKYNSIFCEQVENEVFHDCIIQMRNNTVMTIIIFSTCPLHISAFLGLSFPSFSSFTHDVFGETLLRVKK